MKHLLLLILSLLPMLANADAVEIDGIYYNLIPKGKIAEVVSNPNKYTGAIVIPEFFTYNGDNYRVTGIGEEAFLSCIGLKSITIPNSVVSIGAAAFRFCSGLTSIIIPNSVTSIGNATFESCRGLTSITISESVTYIPSSAFSSCSSLTSVIIPNSVIYID